MNIFQRIQRRLEDNKCRKIASNHDFNGYKRIYHCHVMKSGGTSINYAFLGLEVANPSQEVFKIYKHPHLRKRTENMVYIHQNEYILDRNEYSYGFSHRPFYKFNFNQETFTFTVIRDPYKRLLSRYKHLRDLIEQTPKEFVAHQLPWMEKDFWYFVQNADKNEIFFHLYLFSPTYTVEEAYQNIKSLNYYGITKYLSTTFEHLSDATGLSLKSSHSHKSAFNEIVPPEVEEKTKELLKDEYVLYNRLKAEWEEKYL